MFTPDNIPRIAKLHADHRGLKLSTVGRLAMGHGHFCIHLTAGRVTIRLAARAIQWFSDHWPAGLEWPSDIPRPALSPSREDAA